MKILLFLILTATVVFAQLDQKTSKENMVRDRGQTRVPNRGDGMNYGRLGYQQMLPENEVTYSGTLIDASCEDRSAMNLHAHPSPLAIQLPAQPATAGQNNPPRQGPVTAGGVTVDAQTLARERTDIMSHQVPDMLTRQEDPTCAVTASTHGYSLLLDDGRLVNFDEGGNTYASAGVLSDARGRAMLNGQASGFKPRVTAKGWILGDRLIVDKIVKFGGQ
jgi:hypothetical protein